MESLADLAVYNHMAGNDNLVLLPVHTHKNKGGKKEEEKTGVKSMEKCGHINMMTAKNKMCNPYTVKS